MMKSAQTKNRVTLPTNLPPLHRREGSACWRERMDRTLIFTAKTHHISETELRPQSLVRCIYKQLKFDFKKKMQFQLHPSQNQILQHTWF